MVISSIIRSFSNARMSFTLVRSSNSSNDEKGNIFEYHSGITREIYLSRMKERASTLNPKSNNDVFLFFEPHDRRIKIRDIGSNFAFSLTYVLYDPKDDSTSKYNVSFSNIKAQKPR